MCPRLLFCVCKFLILFLISSFSFSFSRRRPRSLSWASLVVWSSRSMMLMRWRIGEYWGHGRYCNYFVTSPRNKIKYTLGNRRTLPRVVNAVVRHYDIARVWLIFVNYYRVGDVWNRDQRQPLPPRVSVSSHTPRCSLLRSFLSQDYRIDYLCHHTTTKISREYVYFLQQSILCLLLRIQKGRCRSNNTPAIHQQLNVLLEQRITTYWSNILRSLHSSIILN